MFGTFIGSEQVLNFLCFPTPENKSYSQFWVDFHMTVVLALAGIMTALTKWQDFLSLLSLLRLVCACTYQILQIYTSTIDMVATDCAEFCYFWWQKFKPPAIFVTTEIIEMLWQWEELLFLLSIIRLLCNPLEQQLLNLAKCCKEALLTIVWCMTAICNRKMLLFVLWEILQILGLEEVTRLLYEWTTTIIWHIIMFVLHCLQKGTQACKLRRKCVVTEHNLAFGGRGCGVWRGPKRERAAKTETSFNVTLGSPGEG